MEKNEEKYWSRFSESYDGHQAYVVGDDLLDAINGKLDALPGLGDMVEFGCGTGYFTRAVAQKADHVTATDLSDELLSIAEKRFAGNPKVLVQKEDCMNPSFPSDRFDSVLMANVIHVIENPLKAIQESRRILKDDGMLVIVSFTNDGMTWFETIKLGFRFLKAWGKPPRNAQSISLEKLRSLVKTAGFLVEKAELIGNRTKALYLIGRKT